jgi:hypothetical protein
MKRALMLAAAPLAGKLLITGSFTMAPIVEDLGKRFRTRRQGVVITDTLAPSGSMSGHSEIVR